MEMDQLGSTLMGSELSLLTHSSLTLPFPSPLLRMMLRAANPSLALFTFRRSFDLESILFNS